jgi:hypothetical protein
MGPKNELAGTHATEKQVQTCTGCLSPWVPSSLSLEADMPQRSAAVNRAYQAGSAFFGTVRMRLHFRPLQKCWLNLMPLKMR